MDDTNRNLSPKSTATDQIDGDPAVWAAFSQNFRQVQSVLDRNRLLIQQVNDNHQSKVHDNLVKNVSLIQEINGNISKVVSMYSDLSSNFSTVCHQHRAANTNSSDKR
ncbi:protein EARLY FLOWERING 4-like [Salvia divinorum]|uniref:Protein EARLY FLOWERING 4-like n=1 Tax=Salvia divinorum TaxID=28513 RepID=A0ABD1HVJ6_SALDI